MEINRAEQIGVLFNPIEINEKEGIPMGRKKLVCIFLVCLAMIGSFCIPAGAVKKCYTRNKHCNAGDGEV